MNQPRISDVHKQMAKEVMKKMWIKSIDRLVKKLIQEKYNGVKLITLTWVSMAVSLPRSSMPISTQRIQTSLRPSFYIEI